MDRPIASAPIGRRAWHRNSNLTTVPTALAALALWALGAWNAVEAARYPFVLDAREGTNWLLGLARSAGQDIYDHSQVAFVNMNHGPLDPILKSWVHDFLPAVPGHVANRAFVLTLPVMLAVLGFILLRDRPWLGLLLSGALYCVLLGIGPRVLLVGRSDPLAMTLLAGQLTATAVSWRARRRRVLLAAAIGVLAGATLLANWRFAPVSLAAAMVWLVPPAGASTGRRPRAELLWSAAGFVAIVLAVFLAELHAKPRLVYQHFILFFREQSGWGASATAPLGSLVGDIWDASRGAVSIALVAWVACAMQALRARSRAMVWLGAGAFGTAITVYGLYRNTSGGGLIYLAPAYLLLWFVLVAAVRELSFRIRYWQPLMLVVLVVALPWRAEERQAHRFAREMPALMDVSRRLDAVLQHEPVYSEDLHLFRRSYTGQVIDMGDEVEVIAIYGSYGRAFTGTAAGALASLQRHPPPYVFSGGTQSSVLRRLLANRYEPVLTTPSASPGTLYRLRPGTENAGTAQPARGLRPTFFRPPGQRSLSARAPDAAIAQAWCRRAQDGTFAGRVRPGTFVVFLLLNSHGQEYSCPVP